MTLRLVIFDVDGTLVDSQAEIMAAMQTAYAAQGLQAPSRQEVLSIVGLSLAEAFQRLSPDADTALLAQAYKDSFADSRRAAADRHAPLYPGALTALRALSAQDNTLLAVATGKSKRGLDAMIDLHGLAGLFISRQTADFHPSKPHPSMIRACLDDAGLTPERAVMVGDTTYDMDMAAAAGVRRIGVTWGYHPASALDADHLIDDFADLCATVDKLI